jgi:redox-sensitive bicupin YhaK (pirin superfamily)
MITVRKSEERRHIVAGNQSTWMTFDWENTADRLREGFGVLKIFNEEILSPGRGFILHTHKDMVVVTYVQEGVVVYNGPGEKTGLLESGEFQQMKITTGAKRFTFNALPDDQAHVFQSGFAPGTETAEIVGEKKLFTLAERRGILRLIASPDGKEASLKIQQDVQMYSTLLHKGNHMIHELKPGRKAWLHVVSGKIQINGMDLKTGDGVGISDDIGVSFTAQEPTEILLFDLP